MNEKRSMDPEAARYLWKKAYGLYLQAFKKPETTHEQKKLAKLLKRPLPADVEHDLFDYSLGFLRRLGMVSLSKYIFLILFLSLYLPTCSDPTTIRRSRSTRWFIHPPCTFEPFLHSQRLHTSSRPTQCSLPHNRSS